MTLSIRTQWPLHFFVWEDNSVALNSALQSRQHDREMADPRGRTPLHLAVTLQRVKCVQVLLNHGANTLAVNRHHWNVFQEAICTGNSELAGLVLQYRDEQLAAVSRDEIPVMLAKLESTSDFYIEMTWKFSSWVPLVSRLCPSDTYRIWKKGTNVRVDTTLIGFERLSWVRGNLSFVFRVGADGARTVSEINHDRKTVFTRVLQNASSSMPSYAQDAEVAQKMQSPVVTTYINTDTVAFQKQKSVWGFESQKTETIDGHSAKVFNATGLDIVTKTRMEHVPEAKRPSFKNTNPIQNLLGTHGDDGSTPIHEFLDVPQIEEAMPPPITSTVMTEGSLSMQEYFQEPKDHTAYDAIGRAVVENAQVQPLKAKVYLAENYPLSLQDQIMPIIDLMAQNNIHFAKLKDFITLQIPSGFPIKFEIPLFRVMTATVTFQNINGSSQPAQFVSLKADLTHLGVESEPVPAPSASKEGGILRRRGRESARREENSDKPLITKQSTLEVKEVCVVSDDCFAIPVGYHDIARGYSQLASDEDDQLQQAIRQSLLDQEATNPSEGEPQLTLTEMLNDRPAVQDEDLMWAIRASLQPQQTAPAQPPRVAVEPRSHIESDLEMALALSRAQVAEDERMRQQEDEELQKVLQLSLQEK